MASGLFIIFAEPLRIGSLCHSQNICGIVEKISLNRTTIRCRDGSHIYVPNGIFANFTQTSQTRTTDTITCTKILRVSSRLSNGVLNEFMDALRSQLGLLIAENEERSSRSEEMEDTEEKNLDRISIRLRSLDTVMIEVTLRHGNFGSYEAAKTQVNILFASSER